MSNKSIDGANEGIEDDFSDALEDNDIDTLLDTTKALNTSSITTTLTQENPVNSGPTTSAGSAEAQDVSLQPVNTEETEFKPFPFMKLPLELQTMVIDFAFGEDLTLRVHPGWRELEYHVKHETRKEEAKQLRRCARLCAPTCVLFFRIFEDCVLRRIKIAASVFSGKAWNTFTNGKLSDPESILAALERSSCKHSLLFHCSYDHIGEDDDHMCLECSIARANVFLLYQIYFAMERVIHDFRMKNMRCVESMKRNRPWFDGY